MRVTITCLAALTVLAACSKAPSAGGAGASGTAAAPSAPASAPAAGPSLFSRPHPRAGLWEMTMTNNAGPGVSLKGELCVDPSTEKSAFEANPRNRPKNCDEPQVGPAPGGVAFDTTCTSDGRKITSHVVATGDFNSAYTLDMTTQMDPPPPGMSGGFHTHMQAHWLGPCRPGQTPGHMSMKMTGLGQG